MRIAINTACYIARESGYALRPFAWGQARSATMAAFAGPQFGERLNELAKTIRALGASQIELWSAHLSAAATGSMIDETRAILASHQLSVGAYAASLRRPGLEVGELERTFTIAASLGIDLIAGGLHPAYAGRVFALCREHGIRFAVENHPEREPLELLAQIDGREEWFGTAIDTGWYQTNGANVLSCIRTLASHIIHVHLKDVRAVGLPHRTCQLGDGIVDITAVLQLLKDLGYRGLLSLEHEPPDHDPGAELRVSLSRVERWLASGVALAEPLASAGQ